MLRKVVRMPGGGIVRLTAQDSMRGQRRACRVLGRNFEAGGQVTKLEWLCAGEGCLFGGEGVGAACEWPHNKHQEYEDTK